jgi:hypothetical protein
MELGGNNRDMEFGMPKSTEFSESEFWHTPAEYNTPNSIFYWKRADYL